MVLHEKGLGRPRHGFQILGSDFRVCPGSLLIAADAQVCFHGLSRAQHPLQGFRVNPVVVVVEENPLAVRVVVDPVQAGVSRRADSGVLLMNDVHPGVFRSIAIADFPAIVRAAVVHQDELQVPEGLTQNALDAPGQILRHFVNRHNHTDLGHDFSSCQGSRMRDRNISSTSFTMRLPSKNALRFWAPAFTWA